MNHRDAFWIDHEHDRSAASDGVSRYGAYIRDRIDELADCWDDWNDSQTKNVKFAAAAWRIATGPIMSPSYVRFHPRILAAHLARNDWDSSLSGSITVVTPWPAPLTRSREWRGGTWWRDWPTYHLGDETHYVDPSGEDLTRSSYLMASAQLAFPIPLTSLPIAPAGPEDRVEETARAAVRALTSELNRAIMPVITAVDSA